VAECQALLIRARVARATDGGQSQEAAFADLDAAQTLAQEMGAGAYEPFIREELGRLHQDESELAEALHLYKAIGATGHARRLEAELAASTGNS
jgi:hypothetical protein